MLLYTKASFSVLENLQKTRFYFLENFSSSQILKTNEYQDIKIYFWKLSIFIRFLTYNIWSSCKVLLNLQL